jgi:hypothetical protein
VFDCVGDGSGDATVDGKWVHATIVRRLIEDRGGAAVGTEASIHHALSFGWALVYQSVRSLTGPARATVLGTTVAIQAHDRPRPTGRLNRTMVFDWAETGDREPRAGLEKALAPPKP